MRRTRPYVARECRSFSDDFGDILGIDFFFGASCRRLRTSPECAVSGFELLLVVENRRHSESRRLWRNSPDVRIQRLEFLRFRLRRKVFGLFGYYLSQGCQCALSPSPFAELAEFFSSSSRRLQVGLGSASGIKPSSLICTIYYSLRYDDWDGGEFV